jgi:hypothetical protein
MSKQQNGVALAVCRGGSTDAGVSMIVHTQDIVTPGVGEYDVGSARNKQLVKSPNATIGKTVRFAR